MNRRSLLSSILALPAAVLAVSKTTEKLSGGVTEEMRDARTYAISFSKFSGANEQVVKVQVDGKDRYIKLYREDEV